MAPNRQEFCKWAKNYVNLACCDGILLAIMWLICCSFISQYWLRMCIDIDKETSHHLNKIIFCFTDMNIVVISVFWKPINHVTHVGSVEIRKIPSPQCWLIISSPDIGQSWEVNIRNLHGSSKRANHEIEICTCVMFPSYEIAYIEGVYIFFQEIPCMFSVLSKNNIQHARD